MSRNLHAMILAAVAASGAMDIGARADDSPLLKRFLEEYPEAMKRLESRYGRSSGSVRFMSFSTPEPRNPRVKPPTEANHDEEFISHRPEMARVTVRLPISKLYDELVTCYNSRYEFRLLKPKEKPNYVINLVDFKKKPDLPEVEGRYLWRYLNAPYCLLFLPVGRLMSHPDRTIKDATRVEVGGKECLKVSFVLPRAVSGKDTSGGHEGWFMVSPQERWVVREYQLRPLQGKVIWTGKIEYEGLSEGFPVPRKITHRSALIANPAESSTETYDFREFRFIDAPDDVFTLSNFGLPEPTAPDSSPNAAPVVPAKDATPPSGDVKKPHP